MMWLWLVLAFLAGALAAPVLFVGWAVHKMGGLAKARQYAGMAKAARQMIGPGAW